MRDIMCYLNKEQFESIIAKDTSTIKIEEEEKKLPSIDVLKKQLDFIPILKQAINEVENTALKYLESGQTIPGYKLENRYSREKCTNVDSLLNEISKLSYNSDAIYKNEKILKSKKEILAMLGIYGSGGHEIVLNHFKKEIIGQKIVKDESEGML